MKKCIAFILLTALMAAFAVMTVSADTFGETTDNYYIIGDADGDYAITVIDATRIQRVLADLHKDTDGMIALRGDSNHDGLDILDATAIQRFLVDYVDNNDIGDIVYFELPSEAVTDAPTSPATQTPTRDLDELPFVPKH